MKCRSCEFFKQTINEQKKKLNQIQTLKEVTRIEYFITKQCSISINIFTNIERFVT